MRAAKATGASEAVADGSWTHVRACRTCFAVLDRSVPRGCPAWAREQRGTADDRVRAATEDENAPRRRRVRQVLRDTPVPTPFLVYYKVR